MQHLRIAFPRASIGTYLVVMTGIVTLPLIAFTAYLMFQLEAEAREDLRRETTEDARSISRSIDRRLQEMATSLRILSNFPELEVGDLQSFHERVRNSLSGEGMHVILASAEGLQKLNTRVTFGEPLGAMANLASLRSAIQSRRIEVSNIFIGTISKVLVFNVTLPLPEKLSRAGAAMIMTQNAADLARLTSTEGLPPGWSLAILDGAGRVIISSAADEEKPGEIFSSGALSKMTDHISGSFEDLRGSQDHIYAYSQLPGWAWKAVVWGPVHSGQAALDSTWRDMIIGSLLLLLVALAGAYMVGRQLRSSIRDISAMAEDIGRGEIVSPVETRIVEANQVAIALSNASFDRSQAEEQVHLILHELVHRSKNILTLVQAMIRQLSREDMSNREFQQAVSDRLRGLGMSVKALAEMQWQGLPMKRLIETHMAVFLDIADHVTVKGDDFMLKPDAVQNFGLILHELATNSVKYGSLSSLHGSVAIRWTDFMKNDLPMLRIEWKETGGPLIKKPEHKGFGSTIIERHAAAAFGGPVEISYENGGFSWVLIAPKRNFLRDDSKQATS